MAEVAENMPVAEGIRLVTAAYRRINLALFRAGFVTRVAIAFVLLRVCEVKK